MHTSSRCSASYRLPFLWASAIVSGAFELSTFEGHWCDNASSDDAVTSVKERDKGGKQFFLILLLSFGFIFFHIFNKDLWRLALPFEYFVWRDKSKNWKLPNKYGWVLFLLVHKKERKGSQFGNNMLERETAEPQETNAWGIHIGRVRLIIWTWHTKKFIDYISQLSTYLKNIYFWWCKLLASVQSCYNYLYNCAFWKMATLINGNKIMIIYGFIDFLLNSEYSFSYCKIIRHIHSPPLDFECSYAPPPPPQFFLNDPLLF